MTQQIVQAAEDLAALLEKENTSLRQSDYSAATSLVVAKQAALTRLTGLVAKSPGVVRASRLSALGQRLKDLAAANEALLGQALAIQSRIVQIVAGAKPKAAPGLYSDDPRLRRAASLYRARP